MRWVDEVVKEHTEPAPAIEPYVVLSPSGEELAAINVLPAMRPVGLRSRDAYEFPIRTADSRRYLRLAEIEARMQDQDRVHRLRLEQIGSDDKVGLDATVDRELGHNGWRVVRVGDDVVVLEKGLIEVPVPLAYVEAVYRAGLQHAEWVIDLNCYVSKHRHQHVIAITKELPFGRNLDRYRVRGLSDE